MGNRRTKRLKRQKRLRNHRTKRSDKNKEFKILKAKTYVKIYQKQSSSDDQYLVLSKGLKFIFKNTWLLNMKIN